jgi:hypothetical protein
MPRYGGYITFCLRLETKLLEGKGCENSTDKVFSVLQRITWLNKKGVAFTFNFEQKKKDLKNICPESAIFC